MKTSVKHFDLVVGP